MKYLCLILLLSLNYCASSTTSPKTDAAGSDASLLETIKAQANSEEGKKMIQTIKEKAQDKETQEKIKALFNKGDKK